MPKLENDFPVDKRRCPPGNDGIYLHEEDLTGILRLPPFQHRGSCARLSGDVGADALRGGFALGLLGGPGAAGPPPKCNANGTPCRRRVCLGFVFPFCFVFLCSY